jgi:hypothetical protein
VCSTFGSSGTAVSSRGGSSSSACLVAATCTRHHIHNSCLLYNALCVLHQQIRQFLEGNLECDRGTHGPVFPTNAPLEAYDEEHKPAMVADSAYSNGANSSTGGNGGGISYYLRRASVQASVRHMAADVSDAVSSLAGRIGLVHNGAAAVYSVDDPAAAVDATRRKGALPTAAPTAAVPGRRQRRSSDPGAAAVTARVTAIQGTISNSSAVTASSPMRQGPLKLPPLQRNVRGDDSSVASH